MKLYDGGRAPNPRRVRIYLAEKNIEVPIEPVDMAAGQHKSDAITALNPLQRLPILELDDGTILTESMAICRYFEALYPDPPLFGRNAEEIARIEMWNRRLELDFYAAVQAVFRHSHPGMKDAEGTQIAEWAQVNRGRATDFLTLFDRHLESNAFAAGDAFSVADITGLVAVNLMKPAKLTVPDDLSAVQRWLGDVSDRPSAGA